MHKFAMPAAQRFEAIALQSSDKAYKFHDKVFQDQQKLSASGESFLDEVATSLKVNMKKMKTDMASAKVKARIQSDVDEAQFMGISGTPGFNVGGVVLKGAYPPEAFIPIIDKRLEENRQMASSKSAGKKGKKEKKAVPAEGAGATAPKADAAASAPAETTDKKE